MLIESGIHWIEKSQRILNNEQLRNRAIDVTALPILSIIDLTFINAVINTNLEIIEFSYDAPNKEHRFPTGVVQISDKTVRVLLD